MFYDPNSKLSLHADCCNKLASNNSCYKAFVKIILKHDSKQVIKQF